METLLITRKTTTRKGGTRFLRALFCLGTALFSPLPPLPLCLLIFTWGYLFVAPAAAAASFGLACLALFSGFFSGGCKSFGLFFSFFFLFYCCAVKILLLIFVVPQFSCSLNNFSAWKFSSPPLTLRHWLCSSCRCPGSRRRHRRRRRRWKVFIESCNLNLLGFTF